MQNNIKRIREQNGITRKELAALSGVHYKKITDYENNYIKFENITDTGYKMLMHLCFNLNVLIELWFKAYWNSGAW